MYKRDLKAEDIALQAGVSPATVSRVLNGVNNVSEKTKSKVLEAMRYLGHGTPTENLVGLILPDASNPFFSDLAFHFEKEFSAKGWHLLVSSSEGKLAREVELYNRFKGLGVKGLLYISSGAQDFIAPDEIISDNKTAVLVFDRKLNNIGLDYVAVNSKEGTLAAVDYLVTYGHERIGYLKGLNGTQSAQERYFSFTSAMQKNELEVNPNFVFDGDFQLDSGRTCADMLVEMKRRQEDLPTAIICGNDLMAIGLMQRLQEVGWKIPKQLSVIGFDDISWSQWTTPSLTTLSQPKKTLVNKAIQILINRVKAIEEDVRIKAKSVEISPTLIPRKSVTQPFHLLPEL